MTFSFILFSWLVVIACLAVALLALLRIVAIFQRHTAATRASTPGKAPKLPVVALFIWAVALVLALVLMAASSVWMPRADVSVPAENTTIMGKNAERFDPANRPTVVPATPVNTNDARAAARAQAIQETKQSFEALPDDE